MTLSEVSIRRRGIFFPYCRIIHRRGLKLFFVSFNYDWMKITKMQIYDVDFGWNERSGTRWNPVILRVVTDQDIYGSGEVAMAYGSGAKAAIRMLQELGSQFLLGADPLRIGAMWENMFRRTFWGQGGGPVIYGAMSAIDEALWDIKGKSYGVPVYELFGGKIWERLRVYANNWYTGLGSPEEYAEAAHGVVANGYNALKFDPFAVTIDGRWENPRRHIDSERAQLSIQRVKAVREAVGEDVDILVEVHGNLGTSSAIQIGKRLEETHPFFYEEPVDPLNVECMKKVAENVNIPIAGGERLYTRYQFRPFIEGQALDILQPDIGLTGGLTEVRKIAAYAETYNLHVKPHNCGGPVSTAVAVQFDACTTNFIIQEWFSWDDDRANIVTDPLEPKVKNSYLETPNLPGLGIELNDDYLSRFDCIEVS